MTESYRGGRPDLVMLAKAATTAEDLRAMDPMFREAEKSKEDEVVAKSQFSSQTHDLMNRKSKRLAEAASHAGPGTRKYSGMKYTITAPTKNSNFVDRRKQMFSATEEEINYWTKQELVAAFVHMRSMTRKTSLDGKEEQTLQEENLELKEEVLAQKADIDQAVVVMDYQKTEITDLKTQIKQLSGELRKTKADLQGLGNAVIVLEQTKKLVNCYRSLFKSFLFRSFVDKFKLKKTIVELTKSFSSMLEADLNYQNKHKVNAVLHNDLSVQIPEAEAEEWIRAAKHLVGTCKTRLLHGAMVGGDCMPTLDFMTHISSVPVVLEKFTSTARLREKKWRQRAEGFFERNQFLAMESLGIRKKNALLQSTLNKIKGLLQKTQRGMAQKGDEVYMEQCNTEEDVVRFTAQILTKYMAKHQDCAAAHMKHQTFQAEISNLKLKMHRLKGQYQLKLNSMLKISQHNSEESAAKRDGHEHPEGDLGTRTPDSSGGPDTVLATPVTARAVLMSQSRPRKEKRKEKRTAAARAGGGGGEPALKRDGQDHRDASSSGEEVQGAKDKESQGGKEKQKPKFVPHIFSLPNPYTTPSTQGNYKAIYRNASVSPRMPQSARNNTKSSRLRQHQNNDNSMMMSSRTVPLPPTRDAQTAPSGSHGSSFHSNDGMEHLGHFNRTVGSHAPILISPGNRTLDE